MERSDARPAWARIDLTWRSLFKAIAVVAAVWFLSRVWPVLLAIMAALIVVGTLGPIVGWLCRRGLKRRGVIALVFGGLLSVIAGAAAFTVPKMATQVMEMVAQAPELQRRTADLLAGSTLTAPLSRTVRHFKLDGWLKPDAERALGWSSMVAEGVGYTITILFLALYLMLDRDRARGALYALVPRDYHVRVARIVLNLETIVGGYMRGQMFTSVCMGAFTYALLLLLGIPNALTLAMFAAATDVLPFVGGLVALVPIFFASLAVGPTATFIALTAMVVYQELESRVIIPRVYGRALLLPPAAVIVALMLGWKLLGILGAVLSLPVAAGLRMIIAELRVALPGDDSDDTALRRRDDAVEEDYARRSAGTTPAEAAAVAVEIADEVRHADADNPEDAAEVPVTGGDPHSER